MMRCYQDGRRVSEAERKHIEDSLVRAWALLKQVVQ
jgi:hypothetical protein